MISKVRKIKGVTMLELLLVLVIIATVMAMIVGFIQQKTDEFKRDKAAMQVQMILNAGLAYYINSNLTSPQNSPEWPANLAALQTANYLPATLKNPWGQPYTAGPADPTNPVLFQVSTTIPGGASADVDAQILAGRLPLATCSTVSTIPGCTGGAAVAKVDATVPIPGQNLNNARAVNFASLYSVNGCVPKPNCPLNMIPAIYVVPVSVSGSNSSSGVIPAGTNVNVFPISSFTASAIDLGVAATGNDCSNNPNVACQWGGDGGTGAQPAGAPGFWRVCLSVTSQSGSVPLSTAMGTVLAVTKCVPQGENPGTGLGVL